MRVKRQRENQAEITGSYGRRTTNRRMAMGTNQKQWTSMGTSRLLLGVKIGGLGNGNQRKGVMGKAREEGSVMVEWRKIVVVWERKGCRGSDTMCSGAL